MPDYFDGEFVDGMVLKATFSVKEKHPVMTVRYKVGSEAFLYTSYQWNMRSYKKGERITMIYSPSNPEIASTYTFIGYWITLRELFFTAVIFIILFIAAMVITGKNNIPTLPGNDDKRKRKYDV